MIKTVTAGTAFLLVLHWLSMLSQPLPDGFSSAAEPGFPEIRAFAAATTNGFPPTALAGVAPGPAFELKRDASTNEWEWTPNRDNFLFSYRTNDITERGVEVSENWSQLWWTFGFTNVLDLTVSTNYVTNWTEISRTNSIAKEVGILSSNRVLTVVYRDRTNLIELEHLGTDEWPSQRRTNDPGYIIINAPTNMWWFKGGLLTNISW